MKQIQTRQEDKGKVIPLMPRQNKQLAFPFIEDPLLLNKALHSAARAGKAKKIAELVRSRGANVNAADKYGETPLMHAAKRGNLKACRVLIQMKADINLRDNYGMTAIHHAIDGGHTITAAFLRRQGARW